jgi:predicted enzyme related to lactoylglutathione lyase
MRRNNMLNKYVVTANLPAVDLARAKKFYVEKLGLKVIREDPGPGAMFEAGKGSQIYLYQRGQTKADHTAASFRVDDVEKVVKELKDKGVIFEQYDMPGIKTVNSIAAMGGKTKGAWFKDTEGNILGLIQM